MRNVKKVKILSTLLLIVGIIGSIFTFKSAFSSESMVTTEQSMEIGDIRNFDIAIDNGTVKVLPSDNDLITFELSATAPDDILTIDKSETTLSIDVKDKRKKWFNFDILFTKQPTLIVYIPQREYDKVNIQSNNGKVEAHDIIAKAIDVETDNGKILMENITGSAVHAEADNGRINLNQVSSKSITVRASNGKIVLEDVEGEIVGKTDNGSISLRTDHIDRSLELTTANGKINVRTNNKPTNAILDVQVGNGKARVFGESKWDTIIGNGDNLVKLRTGNGSITVE